MLSAGLLGGAGEVVSQIPTALAEQFPQIAATLGSARAGAMAGQRIAGPRGALNRWWSVVLLSPSVASVIWLRVLSVKLLSKWKSVDP
jgi:hypothetical protein